MKKQKLNHRFHNPNTAEVTVDYILKRFIEVNGEKVVQAMQKATERINLYVNDCDWGRNNAKISC